MLTLPEVARRLRVSLATAHRLVRHGAIPAVILRTHAGGRRLVRVPARALEALMGASGAAT